MISNILIKKLLLHYTKSDQQTNKNHIENKTEYIVSEVDIEVVDDDNEKFGLIKILILL